jgi:hypothetical protein
VNPGDVVDGTAVRGEGTGDRGSRTTGTVR